MCAAFMVVSRGVRRIGLTGLKPPPPPLAPALMHGSQRCCDALAWRTCGTDSWCEQLGQTTLCESGTAATCRSRERCCNHGTTMSRFKTKCRISRTTHNYVVHSNTRTVCPTRIFLRTAKIICTVQTRCFPISSNRRHLKVAVIVRKL